MRVLPLLYVQNMQQHLQHAQTSMHPISSDAQSSAKPAALEACEVCKDAYQMVAQLP